MSINWNTPVSELMHSDTTPLLGLIESDEELMHFKYIKREKKNGRWVYYYDQSELDRLANEAKTADRVARKISSHTGPHSIHAQGFYYPSREKKALRRISTLALANAEKAIKAYERKRIISFPARTISKGLVRLGNFLSGLTRKKKKK